MSTKPLTESSAINIFLIYKFITILSKPFKDWDEFNSGIIDDAGKILKKGKMETWKVLIRNIKRLVEKLPFGKTKLGSFAASLWLIKEEMKITSIDLLETEFLSWLDTQQIYIEFNKNNKKIKPGTYFVENKLISIKSDCSPNETLLGEDIYKLKDLISNKYFYISDVELLETTTNAIASGSSAKNTNTDSISIPTGGPSGKFMGLVCFDCDPNTFQKVVNGKKKYKKWNKFMQNDSLYSNIKNWQNSHYKNAQTNFILRNSVTGAMVHARN